MRANVLLERMVFTVAGLITAALTAAAGFQMFWSPPSRPEEFRQQLAAIEPVEMRYEKQSWPYEEWQEKLASRPALWKELVKPPPPPKAAPPPPPDLAKILAGVTAGRQQVGDRAKIMTPGDKRGSFMGVGEQVNGCTIKEVSKKEVVFVMMHLDQEIKYAIPRE